MTKKIDANHKHFTNNQQQGLVYDCDKLQRWLLYTPLGRDILHRERIFLRQNVEYIFGNYSLQIGLSKINLLQGNKIPYHYTINVDLKSDLRFMPIADNSIDLIVCPHVLEFTDNYHHVLQELSRILAPHGRIIISCFNRRSWFGLLKKRITLLRNANLISLEKLKDQLQMLNLRIEAGKFFSYCPPFSKSRTLTKYRWLNKVGDRWFPTFANSFTVIISKEVLTPTLIKSTKNLVYQPLTTNLGAAGACSKN